MVKKIYIAKVSEKRGKRRPRLYKTTFLITIGGKSSTRLEDPPKGLNEEFINNERDDRGMPSLHLTPYSLTTLGLNKVGRNKA